MGIQPVYDRDGIVIYHGDCRAILPTLNPLATVVTDPPYGIGFKYGGAYQDRGGSDYMALLEHLKPFPCAILQYPEEAMRYLVPVFGPPDECFIWAYNSNLPRQSRIWSFWDCDVDFSRVRVKAKNQISRVRQSVAHYDWASDIQQVKNTSREKRRHPCQIPAALMKRVLSFIEGGAVLDPFAGTGTTLVAAKALGRAAIGIELEERYVEIAIRRLGQKVFNFAE